jgi:hypothetical protein
MVLRLALALGYANPDAMLAEMKPRHLAEWLAFYRIEPWGETRADIRAALQTMQLVSASGAKPTGGGYFELGDFLLDFRPRAESLLEKAKTVFFNFPSKKKG